MRKPSIKTLARAFGENAHEARRIFEMTRAELKERADVRELENSVFGTLKNCTLRLHALNTCGGFHGVESIETARMEYAEYLNSGDVYNMTVIYWRGHYRVQTLGDFVETMERRAVKFK